MKVQVTALFCSFRHFFLFVVIGGMGRKKIIHAPRAAQVVVYVLPVLQKNKKRGNGSLCEHSLYIPLSLCFSSTDSLRDIIPAVRAGFKRGSNNFADTLSARNQVPGECHLNK
ncbi:hypothetical protein Barb6XT_01940 [Bacteroidales bacterium Barb6XT]|nr:hypothetical protein Barb6XT_01940 [Bacteroidales bacterium Barb6XT]